MVGPAKHHISVKTDNSDVSTRLYRSRFGPACRCSAPGGWWHSLNLTDIQTTWVETRSWVKSKKESPREATIRQALLFKMLGIDSDNGSEFINAHLYHYYQALDIQFT